MKLIINYDLIDKIRESKTGFSLNRYVSKVSLNACFLGSLDVAFGMSFNLPISDTLVQLAESIIFSLGLYAIFEKTTAPLNKDYADGELIKLITKLEDINVSTNLELLKQAYKYKTEYDISFEDSNTPKIEQRKYIMVPTHNEWNDTEISLVQEHVIGSKIYTLAHGEPDQQKVYSFGPRKAFL